MEERKTILVIEDNEVLVENISLFLHEEGYEVEFAYNGADGVQKAIAIQPALILCDVMMPQMDGFEVKKILNENKLTINIPFVFLTAVAERAGLKRGMELDADDYLVKPFTFVNLLKIIKNRIN
jgi:CheY-like chemotaxis protein